MGPAICAALGLIAIGVGILSSGSVRRIMARHRNEVPPAMFRVGASTTRSSVVSHKNKIPAASRSRDFYLKRKSVCYDTTTSDTPYIRLFFSGSPLNFSACIFFVGTLDIREPLDELTVFPVELFRTRATTCFFFFVLPPFSLFESLRGRF